MKMHRSSSARRRAFTLPEVLIAGALLAVVAGGAATLYILYQRIWRSASLRMQADRASTLAMNRMVYGTGTRRGLRAAVATSVVQQNVTGGWNLTYVSGNNVTNRVEFRSADRRLTLQPGGLVLGEGVVAATATQLVGRTELMVRVGLTEGRFNATNEVRTAVRWRN